MDARAFHSGSDPRQYGRLNWEGSLEHQGVRSLLGGSECQGNFRGIPFFPPEARPKRSVDNSFNDFSVGHGADFFAQAFQFLCFARKIAVDFRRNGPSRRVRFPPNQWRNNWHLTLLSPCQKRGRSAMAQDPVNRKRRREADDEAADCPESVSKLQGIF